MTTSMTRRLRTREALQRSALDLFERQGYDATSVAQIAVDAGVTPMTFFRHFAAKENVLLDDPYDPAIADAVAAEPLSLPPLVRAVRGLRRAWAHVPEPEDEHTRRRVRIVAATPSLRGAVSRNNAETERVIADGLLAGGAEPLAAQVAAAAVIAALTAALYAWASADGRSLADAVTIALDTLEHADG
ncbi:TetR/AcrR family transcriptional regulator [Beutenbergia cavernae]|nr:TetR/AcrR family transcriptional regulator [Beutenbergia cavernae]